MYGSEVLDMVNFEWNAERAKEVIRQEERDELTTQFTLSLLKNKAPMHMITDATHLSIEEVERIAKEHQLAI